MTTLHKFTALDIVPGAVLVEKEGTQRKVFILERLTRIRFYGVTMQNDSTYHYHEFLWPSSTISGWYMILPEGNNER